VIRPAAVAPIGPSHVGRRRRWRTRWAVALSAAIVLAVSACGVPTSGPPISDGPPPAGGGSDNGGIDPPPGPDVESSSADDFVNDYLAATAGAPTPEGQVATARAYMNAAAASTWAKPNTSGRVSVLRQIGGWAPDTTRTASSDGSTIIDVTGTFDVVGSFVVATGALEPVTAATPPSRTAQRLTLRFSVGDSDDGSGRFRLTDRVPPGLFMSEQALQRWFAPHPVYFWDPNHQALIPDIRYVPLVLSGILQATLIVNWVLGNPSDWINGATQQTVNASLVDPTISVTGDGTYVVNLSTSAHALDTPALLAYQLRWSLGTLTVDAGTQIPMPVEIEIEGQTQVTSSDNSYREHVANLAPSRSSDEASAYAIAAGGKAVAVTINPSTEAVTPVAAAGQPRVLNSSKNTGVTLAAVDGSGSAAALVRADNTGQSLWIRRTGGGAASDFVQVKGLPHGTMSRPEFLAQPAGAVVVAVNGQLKLVDFQNRVHSIQSPSGISNISAFSIAPDAHRIAFVSGGKLYFSVITGGDTPTMTMAQPIVIGPSLATATAVAWSSAYQLIVGGRDGSIGKIAELNIDGSLDPNPFTREYGQVTIAQVAAYSYDPIQQPGFDEVMVQEGMVRGMTVVAGRTAQRPDGGGGKTVALTAPFFQD
jgi:hypothetical protein